MILKLHQPKYGTWVVAVSLLCAYKLPISTGDINITIPDLKPITKLRAEVQEVKDAVQSFYDRQMIQSFEAQDHERICQFRGPDNTLVTAIMLSHVPITNSVRIFTGVSSFKNPPPQQEHISILDFYGNVVICSDNNLNHNVRKRSDAYSMPQCLTVYYCANQSQQGRASVIEQKGSDLFIDGTKRASFVPFD